MNTLLSMSKWPTRSVYIGRIIYYLIYLLNPFPRGLEVDLEASNIFPMLTLLMHIDGIMLLLSLVVMSIQLSYCMAGQLV